ncbi:hypothetical protein CO174_01175 [Candidatus Uhrbacteria bacterium CG_4_9_14_3_um_filter_50_9]|uniref:Uncharacterized protein n=1 Tax=Candidatus Uhrbacteria bacterium CG_4_9_14_3_um_filter_50_9 TaxID=1975035 RepID=A0A2M7XDL9_9BACT|nr:MAG: hypothetical protein CO174_01175 [Candidatus Uhrbacteria bacterium CG_4_9_14_3_um_filter_50_9]
MHSTGFIIHLIGELLIALTVLRVHRQVVQGHTFDKKVINEMKLEQRLGAAGVLFILVGAALELAVGL